MSNTFQLGYDQLGYAQIGSGDVAVLPYTAQSASVTITGQKVIASTSYAYLPVVITRATLNLNILQDSASYGSGTVFTLAQPLASVFTIDPIHTVTEYVVTGPSSEIGITGAGTGFVLDLTQGLGSTTPTPKIITLGNALNASGGSAGAVNTTAGNTISSQQVRLLKFVGTSAPAGAINTQSAVNTTTPVPMTLSHRLSPLTINCTVAQQTGLSERRRTKSIFPFQLGKTELGVNASASYRFDLSTGPVQKTASIPGPNPKLSSNNAIVALSSSVGGLRITKNVVLATGGTVSVGSVAILKGVRLSTVGYTEFKSTNYGQEQNAGSAGAINKSSWIVALATTNPGAFSRFANIQNTDFVKLNKTATDAGSLLGGDVSNFIVVHSSYSSTDAGSILGTETATSVKAKNISTDVGSILGAESNVLSERLVVTATDAGSILGAEAHVLTQSYTMHTGRALGQLFNLAAPLSTLIVPPPLTYLQTTIVDRTTSWPQMTISGATGTQYVFSYYQTVTINSSQVTGTNTYFPVLVTGTIATLKTVGNGGHVQNSNGYDIVFTADSAGTDILPHEIENYVASTGEIEMWVQVPLVTSSANTIIYMWYGNSSITTSQENAGGEYVFGNYALTLHFEKHGAYSLNDSSPRGANATINLGAPASTTGKITSGVTFAGGDGLSASEWNPGTFDFSAEAWIKTTQVGAGSAQFNTQVWGGPSIVGNWENSYFVETGWRLGPVGQTSSGKAQFDIIGNSVIGTTSVCDGNWHHIAGVRQGTSMMIYVDGSLQNTTTISAGLDASGNAGAFEMGFVFEASGTNTIGYVGASDEIRVCKFPLSANWIATQYSNQNAPGTFVTFGTETGGNTVYLPPYYRPSTMLTFAHEKIYIDRWINYSTAGFECDGQGSVSFGTSAYYTVSFSITAGCNVSFNGQQVFYSGWEGDGSATLSLAFANTIIGSFEADGIATVSFHPSDIFDETITASGSASVSILPILSYGGTLQPVGIGGFSITPSNIYDKGVTASGSATVSITSASDVTGTVIFDQMNQTLFGVITFTQEGTSNITISPTITLNSTYYPIGSGYITGIIANLRDFGSPDFTPVFTGTFTASSVQSVGGYLQDLGVYKYQRIRGFSQADKTLKLKTVTEQALNFEFLRIPIEVDTLVDLTEIPNSIGFSNSGASSIGGFGYIGHDLEEYVTYSAFTGVWVTQFVIETIGNSNPNIIVTQIIEEVLYKPPTYIRETQCVAEILYLANIGVIQQDAVEALAEAGGVEPGNVQQVAVECLASIAPHIFVTQINGETIGTGNGTVAVNVTSVMTEIISGVPDVLISNAWIQQDAVEVIGRGTISANVQAVTIEAIHNNEPKANVQAVTIEAVASGDPNANVQSVSTEALHTGDPQANVDQIAIEVLVKFVHDPTAAALVNNPRYVT